MVDFAALKKSREQNIDRMVKAAEKAKTSGGFEKDERFWKVTQDKDGKGLAIIRFLPALLADGEDIPWVQLYNHFWKGPGGYYSENCPTTVTSAGHKAGNCPMCDATKPLWDLKDKGDKAAGDEAGRRKRKLSYISNILVISDEACPENNGKVFLYRYGQKIFDKMNALMNPDFKGQAAVDPFDMWAGTHFRLKVKKEKSGRTEFNNYDDSVFDSPSKLFESDADMEKVWASQHKLQPLIAPSEFKDDVALGIALERASTARATYGHRRGESDAAGDQAVKDLASKLVAAKPEATQAPAADLVAGGPQRRSLVDSILASAAQK